MSEKDVKNSLKNKRTFQAGNRRISNTALKISAALMLVVLLVLPAIWGCSSDAEINSTGKGPGTVVNGDTQEAGSASETTAAETVAKKPVNYYVSASDEFDNYSMVCPDSWELYESGSGSRVLLKNSNSVESKLESILVFVDDVSNKEELKNDADVIESYNALLEDDQTVTILEEEIVKLNGMDSAMISYQYNSILDKDTESEDADYIDCFTFFRNGNYIYSIKYIGKNITESGAKQTFRNFISSFSLDDQVEQQKEKDKNTSVNILILGDDSGMDRPGGRVNGRTDIIILLHLNLDKCKGTAVTIPRDTWVNIPDHGENKINGAHAIGGNELTIETIEQLSGLEIDNYIITDFDGFIPLIDFLGGVTVEVGEDLSDDFSGCYLSKGVHHLDGKTALALSRNRHRAGDGNTQGGAFAREREAAKIIVALLEQKSTFERITAMPLFINYLLRYTWTDLSFMDILKLVPVLGKIKASDIEITGIPSWPQAVGNASAVVYDVDATAELFEDIRNQ